MTEKNNIIISGYMPYNANVKVQEVSIEEVEEKINEKSEDDVKLQIAYDIKIIVDDKEYEPYEFDEDVKVEITDLDYKAINIWHLKDEQNVEKIEAIKKNNKIEFKTTSFSIYGIEEVDENNVNNAEIENDVVNNISNDATTEVTNEILDNATKEDTSEISDDAVNEIGVKAALPPLRAPAPNLPDSTLTINDYTSDYYYYLGKNYTDNPGTVGTTYSDSSLARVTINYHGFAQGESDPEKKGRISLTETQDIVQNIRCVPKGNNVVIELMENPFMDKPTGYGFGGWTASTGTVSQDSKTLTYKLTLNVSGETTVDLYANWSAARVVYVNPSIGCDNLINRGYDGSTPEKPLGSWGAACSRLYSLAANATNRADRENNIIVVTGDIDSSINYSRTITGTITNTIVSADATYTNNGFSTNTSLIITTGNPALGSTALSGNGANFVSTTVTSSLPSTGARWTITGSNGSYSIRNEEGYYLTASNSTSSTLSLSTTQFSSWYYNDGRFYYRVRRSNYSYNYYYFYLYWNGSTWTFYSRQNGTGNYGTSLYFHTYTTTNEVYEEIFSNSAGSLGNNSSYASGNNSNLALTVTSLYGHVDYRPNATIDLTNTSSYNTTIYNDFQMNHVKINATGYTSNTNGTTFNSPLFTGRANNVRIGRGVQCANTATAGAAFANIIGGRNKFYNI